MISRQIRKEKIMKQKLRLDEDQVRRVEEVFRAVYIAQHKAKQFTDSANEMKTELAKELETTAEVVRDSYNQWLKSLKKPDVTDAIKEILGKVKINGEILED